MPVGTSLAYTNGCTDPLALIIIPMQLPMMVLAHTILAMIIWCCFSEYAEGSSNNKYLEIYNPTTSAVSLENYAMALVVNAPAQVGVYDSWHYFDIGSTIPSNGVFVVAHPSADASILSC